MKTKNAKWLLLAAGLFVGGISVLLVWCGNPRNMGFCVACFLRDTAGALGLHRAAPVQYVRPEIIGLVLGSFLMSLGRREFRVQGGSSPLQRFVLGFAVMVGALMFLGCPLRMVLRLAGGDGNALMGLAGFVLGIGAGCLLLRRGFSLGRSQKMRPIEGTVLPVISVALFILLAAGGLGVLIFSESGPGSMHAPIWVALAAGLAVGAIAQLSRLCLAGGIRDLLLMHDVTLLMGFVGIFVAAFAGNLLLGYFQPGFAGQPIAHTDGLWNLLGMLLVGLGSVLLGGCPLRQLILAGEGNSDSALAVLGMLVGAAFCHNFGLASSADGPTQSGKIAVLAALLVVLALGLFNTRASKPAATAKA